MKRATLLHFNVSESEGLDEQVRNWIDAKLSGLGIEVSNSPLDGTALLCGDEDARLAELDALLGIEQVFPTWLKSLREGRTSIEDLKKPETMLDSIQQAVIKHQQQMKDKVEVELRDRENKFRCERDSDEFALLAAAREIRLPDPQDISGLPAAPTGVLWTAAADDLDRPDEGMTASEMQQHLQQNGGIQLIVVSKMITEEAAYLHYPSIANSKLPLIAWAKILATSKISSVAHLALLVDDNQGRQVFDQLQHLQAPASKDLAAVLNVVVVSKPPGMQEKCISMRLNICQPQGNVPAKVTVLDHSGTAYTVKQLRSNVGIQVQAEGFQLVSELVLTNIQAEEGIPQRVMAAKFLEDENEDVAKLLEQFLRGDEQRQALWNWSDDHSIPALRMNITALVEQGIQPIPQPEPLRLHVEDIEGDGILPNQQVLAQEMLSRILIMTGMAKPFQGGPEWFEQSCRKLAETYPLGLQFVVVMPAFQTLRQQTFDRIVKAKLANATDRGIVIPTIWSSKGDYKSFYNDAINPANSQKLFVMIVDECHYGATRQQAQDTYVNGYKADQLQHGSQTVDTLPGEAQLLQQTNFLTLLVSATPYSMLTDKSRIPDTLFVPCHLTSSQQTLAGACGLKPLNVLSKQAASWHLSPSYPSSKPLQEPKWDAKQVLELKAQQVLVELHMIDWNAVDTPKVPYRRIEDYVASMNKPKADQHGIVHDTQFNLKFLQARKQQDGCLTDHVLLVDYLLALQYYRIFRWDSERHCFLDVHNAECKQRVMQAQLSQDYLLELKDVLTPDLYKLAGHLMVAQTTSSWLEDDRQNRDRADVAQLTNAQLDVSGLSIDVLRLQLLLLNKLEAEQARNSYLGSTAEKERNDVYTETDRVVRSLLEVKLQSGKSETCPPIKDPTAQNTGSMIVLRVTTAKVGDEIKTILNKYLDMTASRERGRWKDADDWQLFDVIGDFGFGECKHLAEKLSPWSRKRALSSSHPAWQEPEHKAALEAVDADSSSSHASLHYLAWLKAGLSGSKSATLQYSDLHGVPCLLVLCEKGRMGDTFPQTFCCLDLRIRTSDNHTTFVQEIGRLCRYPACSPSPDIQIPITANSDGHVSLEARLSCLEAILNSAYSGRKESLCDGWQSCAKAISTALHADVTKLIRLLNSFAISTTAIFCQEAFRKICQHVEQALSLPGVDFAKDGYDSLETILKNDLKWDQAEEQFASRWGSKDRVLRKQLPEICKSIMQWKHNTISQWEATGYRHDDVNASSLKEQRPLRLHIDGVFIADALDSADLACILLHPAGSLSISQAISAAGICQLTVSRYAHKLPYALVKKSTKALLMQAHERTTGRLLGQANHEMWAEEVVHNLPVPSKLDRYMQRKGKGKLQGFALHDYRANFKPTKDSYDFDNKSVHSRRLLLKAEPQSGKTGAYLGLLLLLKRLLEPSFCPPVAVLPLMDTSAPPHPDYGRPEAELRWRHPFFTDIRESKFPLYGKVQASKYAEKVVLQRVMLLAKCLATGADHITWKKRYQQLMLSLQGEYLQTQRGRAILREVVAQAPDQPPTMWDPQLGQLTIQDALGCSQVVNWDGRLEAVIGQFLNPQDPKAPLDFAAGRIRVFTDRTSGKRIFRFKDQKIGRYIDAGIAATIVGNQGSEAGYHSIVQDLAWPSPQDEALLAPPAHPIQHPGKLWFQEDLLAHTLLHRQMLQPAIQATQLQNVRLESRDIDGKRAWLKDEIFATGMPVLWAPAQVWEALEQQNVLKVSVARKQSVAASENAGVSWVFVPTFNRYHAKADKQMLLDWSQCMTSHHPYVRFIVIKPLPAEEQGYKQLLQAYYASQSETFFQLGQHTVLLVLPPTINLAAVPSSDKTETVGHELGVGYARLAVQLIACYMKLHRVWLMDDNVQDCYELDYQHMLHACQHRTLQRVSFGDIMRKVEAQFDHGSWDLPIAQLQPGGMTAHAKTKPNGPRDAAVQGEVMVQSAEDFMGDPTRYAMMGISKSIQHCYQVGMKDGPAPWKVTHSIYSMFLLNVKQTVAERAYWPAKPYHDDVDFPRICEEKKLVAAKCQWLFLHKAPMQAPKVCGDPSISSRSSPACHVLHPAGQTLSVGQLVVISVPATYGTPTTLQLSQEQTASEPAMAFNLTAVPAQNGAAQSDQKYVACWEAGWRHLVAPQLLVKIGGDLKDVGAVQEHVTEHVSGWTSCGLFRWEEAEGAVDSQAEPREYAPLIHSDQDDQFWRILCQCSKIAQLQAIRTAVQSQHFREQLLLEDALCFYHIGDQFLDNLGFWNYTEGQNMLKQQGQSILFYENDNNVLQLRDAMKTVLSLLKNAGVQRDLTHAVVVPCWSHWTCSQEKVFADCQRALRNKGKLKAVYSTAPVAQCCNKLSRSSSPETSQSEADVADMAAPEPTSLQSMMGLNPHLVIVFTTLMSKRPRSSGASEDHGLTSKGSLPAADDGNAAGRAPSPSSGLASPASRLSSIQEQGSNVIDLSGESSSAPKRAKKEPRIKWKELMEEELVAHEEHLPPWTIAKNSADDHGKPLHEAAGHMWLAAQKSQTFRTITFTGSTGEKLDKHTPKLIGLKSWYEDTGDQGDRAVLLEQSLFVKMKAAYANADAITSLLKHAFPGCTDVFAYSQGEPLSPTGYAQIMFDSADAKDTVVANMQDNMSWSFLDPVPRLL